MPAGEMTLSEFRAKRAELRNRLIGSIQEIIDAFGEETDAWPNSISVSIATNRSLGDDNRVDIYDVDCRFDL